MFSNLGSMTNFENFHFFSTPSEGGWGKNIWFKICLKFSIFYIKEKSKSLKWKYPYVKTQ